MLDFSARVAGCNVFSKIDLRKGYYQIPVHPADIRKTAICTPFGLFEFRRMPFGLRNAGNTFQRMMDRILAGLSFVFCYLDDIIIASRDEQEYLEHLREVFSRLREAGLVINAEKCVSAATAVEFLGHKVSAAGVEPLRSHVQAVLAHPEPTNISELQAFLGTVNFYRHFLPAAARALKPLIDLLVGGPKGTDLVNLAEPQRAAFVVAKNALAAATCWRTLPKVSSSASWWMLLLTTSAAPCSNSGGRRTRGSRSVFSPGSWTTHRSSIQLSTGSCWPASRPSAISCLCWRVSGSRCTQTTSRSPPPFAGRLSRGQPSSAGIHRRIHERYPAHCGLGQCGGGYAVQAAWQRHRRQRFGVSPASHSPRRPGRQGQN
jgi:hypothetical protein